MASVAGGKAPHYQQRAIRRVGAAFRGDGLGVLMPVPLAAGSAEATSELGSRGSGTSSGVG